MGCATTNLLRQCLKRVARLWEDARLGEGLLRQLSIADRRDTDRRDP
jgi:hypothetical protein